MSETIPESLETAMPSLAPAIESTPEPSVEAAQLHKLTSDHVTLHPVNTDHPDSARAYVETIEHRNLALLRELEADPNTANRDLSFFQADASFGPQIEVYLNKRYPNNPDEVSRHLGIIGLQPPLDQ